MTSNPVRSATGNITFDQATDDGRGGRLHAGDRQAAADSPGTPEGHAVCCNADRDVIGVTIVNARCLLDRDGKITISIPRAHRRQRRGARSGDGLAGRVTLFRRRRRLAMSRHAPPLHAR
jgi:hypothetical protein